MSGAFARGVFEFKTKIAQRPDRAHARELRQAERLPAEVLAARASQRAIELAGHAYRTSGFYREHFGQAGFTDRDFDDAANFAHLPVLEKDLLREAGDALRSSTAPKKLQRSTTGGSTGRPLVVWQDPRTPAASLWWRADRWWGVHPADDSASVYRRSRTPRQEALHRLEWWPTRQILLDARAMDDGSMRSFAELWQRVRPALLTGYVDGLHEFAQFITRAGIDLAPPIAIASTASVLTPSKRAFIESRLAAPVYDCYRSAEVPWIAAQCAKRDGLHVFGDVRIVEVVDQAGTAAAAGVEGDVLVTDLLNPAFPIIRYRIGDRSAIRSGQCACGMTLPRIEPIQGRIVDVLRTPDGIMVTGGLSTLFNDRPTAVTQFQLHQHADYAVTLRYVPGDSAQVAAAAAEEVAGRVRRMLRGHVEVRVEPVDRIEHLGGKARLVTSDLAPGAS